MPYVEPVEILRFKWHRRPIRVVADDYGLKGDALLAKSLVSALDHVDEGDMIAFKAHVKSQMKPTDYEVFDIIDTPDHTHEHDLITVALKRKQPLK